MMSDDGGSPAQNLRPPRRYASRSPSKPSFPVKSISAEKSSSADKKDMTNKRNRRKLHALMYHAKMGVDMTELLTRVKEGEIPRSPIKTLMCASP
jgi:hypothetical protein